MSSNALLIFRGHIHFHFTESWALNNRRLKKNSSESPARSAPPPKYEPLDNRRRETVRSLAKSPYLLSLPPHRSPPDQLMDSQKSDVAILDNERRRGVRRAFQLVPFRNCQAITACKGATARPPREQFLPA